MQKHSLCQGVVRQCMRLLDAALQHRISSTLSIRLEMVSGEALSDTPAKGQAREGDVVHYISPGLAGGITVSGRAFTIKQKAN